MRKLFCAFLMMFISVFAHANIHIDGEVAKQVILSHIDTTYQSAALDVYNQQLESSGDYTISASGLYQVCIAAGWDIKMPDGKTKCDSFVKSLLDGGYAVCGPDKGKTGGTERCIDNVFYALVNGIDVQIGQAIELSKEYALVKYNDDIECSNKSRPGTVNPKNDYVKCTSKLTPTYYEFKFDDVNQSTNTPIYKDTIRAVGNIHGVSFKDSGCSLERIMNNTSCAVGYNTTDSSVCDKLSKSLSRFGMGATVRSVTGASLNYVEKFCAVSFTSNKCTAAKEYGIDNRVFKDIQYPLSPTLENYVKDYVYTQLKVKNIHPASFSCDKMPKRLDKAVAGMHVSDGYTLTCHIDDKCIDFVFEDLSESANYSKNAALSRLACLKHGGAADDKNCRGLDESQCTELGKKIKSNGQFTGTHYDRVRGGCILNGAVAERHINLLGEIAAGVALTLVTDGAATIPVVVSIGTDIAFEAVMDWQRKIPYNDYKDFIQQVLNCSENAGTALSEAIRISGIKSVENKYCLSETIRENYQLVIGQIDKLAPEDQKILADVFENIVSNIGEEEYIRKASESDISLIKSARNRATGVLLAGMVLFNPEKSLSKFDDVARDIAKLRYVASKNFSQHLDEFRRSGKNIKIPSRRLSNTEWQLLNKSLSADGIELVEEGGVMIFKKVVPIENAAVRNFLTRFKYNLDIPSRNYHDILKKWNLPADATDDMIEAHYKMLKTEIELIPNDGWNEAGELKAAILYDYDVIKRTKPNYLKPINTVPSALDNSDEAGRIRIQAMKEKYGIKLEDNTVSIPDGIGDIMRNELGNSNVEKEFYERIRGFIYEYNGVFGNPIDIGDFRPVDEVVPSSSASKDKVAPFRERFGSNPKTVNTATGNNATSQIGFGFNRGDNNTVTRLEPKVVTQTPEVTPKRSWAEIQAAAEEEGRIRIQKFKEKYNLSMENRRKYTKEQWEEILSEELGYSDIEDDFRRDFRKGMNDFYWNR